MVLSLWHGMIIDKRFISISILEVMIRHTLSVMGKRVTYWERNPQWDKTIVMLHGFRGNHSGLTDMAQHFDGWRMILPDLPGYGESEPLDGVHSPLAYAAWLDEFVTQIGLHDWVCWSHSYGGAVSLIQAAEGGCKPRAIVSVSPTLPQLGLSSMIATFYYQTGRLMPAALRQRWISSRVVDHATGRWLFKTATTQRRRRLQRRAERYLPELNSQVVTGQYLAALHTRLAPFLPRVHVPTLIIAGARDVIVPVRQLERLISQMPDGTLVIMEDQGHLAPIERPAATATITKRFLHGIEQPVLAGR